MNVALVLNFSKFHTSLHQYELTGFIVLTIGLLNWVSPGRVLRFLASCPFVSWWTFLLAPSCSHTKNVFAFWLQTLHPARMAFRRRRRRTVLSIRSPKLLPAGDGLEICWSGRRQRLGTLCQILSNLLG